MKYIVEIADNLSCDYLEDILDEYCIGQVHVSKYHETIDEEKLDELANKNCTLQVFYPAIDYEEDGEECAAFSLNNMRNAYKAGYRKAMEDRYESNRITNW